MSRTARTPWPNLPSHRQWLAAEAERLLSFAERSVHPAGGFAWLDLDGTPQLDRDVETLITARMTHCLALGDLLGRPGCGPLVDHGLRALHGRLRDSEHGGWFASVGPQESDAAVLSDKRAYEHAFVILAASSAAAADHTGASELLSEALAVVDQHFWREVEGMVADVWDRTWSQLEPYRGINANMHTVEAFLAAGDVTGDDVWHQRALRITERAVHDFARGNDWLLPEHFDPQWQPLPDYNREQAAHPFRPYGATVGHWLEWARLCLHVWAALGDAAPAWLLEDASSLFATANAVGWGTNGHDGFVYTVGWDSEPVVVERLHWVICEAIGAAAALADVTEDPTFDTAYRRYWDHAAARFLDVEHGSWWHGTTPEGQPSSEVWSGKPDVYHALQATLIPRLPLAPSLATALSRGLLGS
ncbi:MAG: AGE family epimerase/isomerase [Actinomycetales bacterium]